MQPGPRVTGAAARSLLLLVRLFLPCVSHSEQLPLKSYTTADGLAHDHVNRIRRDSRGFLWFCTDEGLARFDGYQFTTYTTQHGLPHLHVNDLLETRSGAYWIATDGGVCRFNPTGSRAARMQTAPPAVFAQASPYRSTRDPLFLVSKQTVPERARFVNAIAQDQAGTIWCGTNNGLYRLEQADGEIKLDRVETGLPEVDHDDAHVNALAVGRLGDLWIGAGSGLYRRRADGGCEHYHLGDGEPKGAPQNVNTLYDVGDRLWVGTRYQRQGLHSLRYRPDGGASRIDRAYSTSQGLSHNDVRSILRSAEGKLWVGTVEGLNECIEDASGGCARFLNYTMTNGLSDVAIYSLVEDKDRNLWIGTYHSGAMRMVRNGLTSYGQADGFHAGELNSIFETVSGDLCVTSGDNRRRLIQCYDGTKFTATQPKLPPYITRYAWGWQQFTFQDHTGEWWVATGQGLLRFPKVKQVALLARARPKAVYTTRNGLGADEILRLYEDSRGDIWIATNTPIQSLSRWERSTGKIHTYGEAAGVPPERDRFPMAFREDASGNVWIAYSENGGLVRYRGGHFERFTPPDGAPTGYLKSLHLDHAGRLWIASSDVGLSRIDDPAADHPRFVRYTTAEGLSSNEIWCMTEDGSGRLYVGTGRGLDRLDPGGRAGSGHVKHYTAADGLAKGGIRVALRSRHGDLWFVTTHGISRLIPKPDPPGAAPGIVISGLRVGGESVAISELGETCMERLELAPRQNHMQIDFLGLDFASGTKLLYQYILEGVDEEWTSPADQRTVTYRNLGPGTYQFKVRALNAAGLFSPTPATIAFRILPPIWQRWWFLTLTAGASVLMIWTVYRYQLGRRLELERVRTRIATDLHDDVGASLSRVAILSEVVKQRMDSTDADSVRILGEIAGTARHIVEGMSDIVWSIDPQRDDLTTLVSRIRQVGSDVLEPRGIRWRLQSPTEMENVKLAAEQRRHVFLICKEAINNIARHAGCASVWLTIDVVGNQFQAEIRDDGCGFAVSESGRPGHGLKNMRTRASELCGHLDISSAPGKGARITLAFPLS